MVFGSKKAKHPFASSVLLLRRRRSKKKNGDAFAFLEAKGCFAFLERKNSWEVERPPNRFFAGERYSERDMRRAGRKNASNLGKRNLRFLSLRLLLGGGKKRKKLRIISPALLKKGDQGDNSKKTRPLLVERETKEKEFKAFFSPYLSYLVGVIQVSGKKKKAEKELSREKRRSKTKRADASLFMEGAKVFLSKKRERYWERSGK